MVTAADGGSPGASDRSPQVTEVAAPVTGGVRTVRCDRRRPGGTGWAA
ncbi:hypothetical protein Ae505Ps2_3993 [Pseudonocardia sp. Ae505_Ps2]|nr:hypothetical protein Ae505Ps2_3993 [Pseudonocardia sp. Ae505_Ps2]